MKEEAGLNYFGGKLLLLAAAFACLFFGAAHANGDLDFDPEIINRYHNSSTAYFCASTTTYQGDASALEGKTIAQINFHNNRISDDILEKEIALKKGRPWRKSDVLLTEDRLNELKLFKATTILSAEHNGEVVVDVYAKDNFYILPIPFYNNGDSGDSYGMILVEGNLLKYGETLFLLGMNGSSRKMFGGGAMYRRSMFMAIYSDEKYYEREYADGAFTTPGYFDSSSKLSDALKLGPIVNSDIYRNKMIKLGSYVTITDNIMAGAFYAHEELSFSEITNNNNLNPGIYSELEFIAAYRSSTKTETRQSSAGIAGALFGMGLSKLKYELNDLEKPILATVTTLKTTLASKAIGSDYNYIIFHAGVQAALETRKHNQFGGYLMLSASGDLPYPKKLSAAFDGQYGDYSRTYFGETRLAMGLSYKQFLLRNRIGVMSLTPFVERINIWSQTSRTRSGHKTGAGIALGYTLWRFPLPLALSYTRSFEDEDNSFGLKIGISF